MSQRNKIRTSRMQQYIRELIKEEGLGLSSDEEEEKENEEQQQGRPGRKKIPERWTRVIAVHSDDLTNLRTYELGPELLLDASIGAPK